MIDQPYKTNIYPQNEEGPYIVWQDYGVEGWKPDSYETLEEAIKAQKYRAHWVITKLVKYKIEEIK